MLYVNYKMLSQPHSQQKDHNLAGIKNFCCKFLYQIAFGSVSKIEFCFINRKKILRHIFTFSFYTVRSTTLTPGFLLKFGTRECYGTRQSATSGNHCKRFYSVLNWYVARLSKKSLPFLILYHIMVEFLMESP